MPFPRLPFAAITLIALTTAASAKPLTITTETNLRAAPGTKSEVVTLIPKGSAIEVGDCDAGWCKVTFGDKEGFAIERNLGTTAPQRAAGAKPDLQKLRRGYENYFDGDGRNDRAADLPAQRRYSQNVPQDNYYDDDDEPPVVYGRPAYVGPPAYYGYGYYPYPRVYYGVGWGRPYGYWRRW